MKTLRTAIAIGLALSTVSLGSSAIFAQTGTRGNSIVSEQKPPVPGHERREMEAQTAKLVEQALSKRAAGQMPAARELLTRAVSELPDFGPAHWQLGELRRERRWLSLDDIEKQSAVDTSLAEYVRQRDDCTRTSGVIWLGKSPNVADPDKTPQYTRAPHHAKRYLRKSFEVADRPKAGELHVQAVGKCDLFINGHPVMAAKANRLSGTERVLGQLHSGKNVIAVVLQGANEHQIAGLRLRLDGVAHDQSIFSIHTDDSWRVSADEAKGWRDAQFDDSRWEPALTSPEPLPGDESAAGPRLSTTLEIALARWCDSHALPEQSRFHWTRALQAQPQSAEAMKALGLVRHGEKMLTKEQLESARVAERDARTALAHWQPVLRKVLTDIEEGSRQRAVASRARLKGAGPAAIPAFEAALQESAAENSAPGFAKAFIEEVLAPHPEPEATRALVRLALDHSSTAVRDAAIDGLKPRDLLDFVPELMGALEAPVALQTSVRQEQNGTAFCQAEFSRKGIETDELRTETYRFEPRVEVVDERVAKSSRSRSQAKELDERSARENEQRASETALAAANQKQAQLKTAVDDQNQAMAQKNERILAIMRNVTGHDQGDKPDAWWTWWKDHNELLHPQQNPVRQTSYYDTEYVRFLALRHRFKDCFAKGTPVWTLAGLRPIETIKVGDAILAQDPDTGELAFRIVLDTSIRAASPMTSVRVGDETIVSTRGHRYWKEGQGWRMAKNLEAGDKLHGVRGPLPIDEVHESPDEPAYNLIVDGFNSYFVGRQAILVHDTGAPHPTLATLPGYRR